MSIVIVTDQQGLEPDILTPVKFEPLVVRTLEGREVCRRNAPFGGWSHKKLLTAVGSLGADLNDGADAFLGDQWIGGTEV